MAEDEHCRDRRIGGLEAGSLRDLSVNFHDLVRGARRELALRYVAEPHIALTEVAFLLGYSELSAFSRAFRQWTGMSPVRYHRHRLERGPAGPL